MRLLVFQHIACEHPGIFRRFLRQDGISWDAVQLDEGDQIPDLSGYDALWVMGGPMDVWETDQHPWLVSEKSAIRRWVRELNKPFLGLCLGHQLLADSLDGKCGPQSPAEIGILDVSLTDAGRTDPIMQNVDTTMKCLQWHSVQVTQMPRDGEILASSDVCACQAMRVGSLAYSMQFHMELEPTTIANWGAIPAYANALEQTLGPGSLDKMAMDADRHMAGIEQNARQLYENFKRLMVA